MADLELVDKFLEHAVKTAQLIAVSHAISQYSNHQPVQPSQRQYFS